MRKLPCAVEEEEDSSGVAAAGQDLALDDGGIRSCCPSVVDFDQTCMTQVLSIPFPIAWTKDINNKRRRGKQQVHLPNKGCVVQRCVFNEYVIVLWGPGFLCENRFSRSAVVFVRVKSLTDEMDRLFWRPPESQVLQRLRIGFLEYSTIDKRIR
jgi:hypothetical protein